MLVIIYSLLIKITIWYVNIENLIVQILPYPETNDFLWRDHTDLHSPLADEIWYPRQSEKITSFLLYLGKDTVLAQTLRSKN